MKEYDRIVCVAGPTASGKTKLAVELAKAMDGEVVSCDSMQLYRGMDIGTAKPTQEEMQGIRHHMLDVAEPEEDFSVSRYVEMADACVCDILARGKTVIVAGGTGLYMDSLIAGRHFAPYPSTGKREALERRADTEGLEALHRELAQVDPETAARLPIADRRRIVRALEVYQETGKSITEHNAQTQRQPPRWHPVWLGLTFEDRAQLYARIDRRVEEMLRAGLVEEVTRLLARGVPPTATAMQAIGYKELTGVLQRGEALEEAMRLIQQRSRNYAKRQLTWLRRETEICWLVQTEPIDFSAIFAQAVANIPFFAR